MGEAGCVAVQGNVSQVPLVDLDAGAVSEYLVGGQTAGEAELLVYLCGHVQPEFVGEDDIVVCIVLFRGGDHTGGGDTRHGGWAWAGAAPLNPAG